MELLVTSAIHFEITPDGSVWARQRADSYCFWQRYLKEFDVVHPIARLREVEHPTAGWLPANGPNVEFIGLPYYVGPYQLMRRSAAIFRALKQLLLRRSALLLRGPCLVGMALWQLLPPGQPYAVEVTGDPYDALGPGSLRDPLRPLWRRLAAAQLKRICGRACASAYVTREALQRRYPPSDRAHAAHYSDVLTTYYSSISLSGSASARPVRTGAFLSEKPRMVCVGSMERLYKGQDVLVEALALCGRRGFDVGLTLVGDGKMRPFLESLAERRGVRDRIRFAGHLASELEIAAELDRADLFVLPSRQEGLPRAMIEAMARGLPAIGSDVGGITELIGAGCVVPPQNPDALANKIIETFRAPGYLADLSLRNLQTVREYDEPVLEARRNAFYQHLRIETEMWLQACPQPLSTLNGIA